MIADHEATGRFDAISQMSAEIATLNTEIETLKHARDAARLRADRAELLNRQMEAQIVSPKREAKTVYSKMKLGSDRDKHDAEVARLLSDGWTFVCDGTVLVADPVERYTTLMRVAPIEPATDQPPMTAAATLTEGNPVGATVQESLTVQTPVYPADPVTFPPAHSSISGLWNALYAMGRFAGLVQHWPKLAEYAPRVHAIFSAAGCDMADVKIMKSFRLGHRADEWTIKVIFSNSNQIAPGTRTSLAAAGVRDLVTRDGREFIFDLPEAWVAAPPRKTITVSSMTIMEAAPATDDSDADLNPALGETHEQADGQPDGFAVEVRTAMKETWEKAQASNPLPAYRPIPQYNPNQGG